MFHLQRVTLVRTAGGVTRWEASAVINVFQDAVPLVELVALLIGVFGKNNSLYAA